MTETAGTVQNGFVLRMSVPATGELGELGPRLGVKLAEQLGVTGPAASQVGEAITELTRAIDPSGTKDVSFEFHKQGAELRIDARLGDAARTTTVALSA
jgi:hypothetical protein